MTNDTAPAGGTPLPPDFDDRQAAWHKAVAGVFARVSRKDVADVPLDVWRKLIKTTYDGVDVNPLYTRADDLPEAPVPGAFPFVRGAAPKPADTAGWDVRETFGSFGGTAKEVNETLLSAMANGTTSVRLDLTGDLGADDVAQLLDGVYPDMAPIAVEAGADGVAAAEAVFAFVDGSGRDVALTRVEAGLAPLTAPVIGSEAVSLDDAVALAVRAAERDGDARAITVDGVAFSNRGATDAQEIGFALAAGVEYLRALVDAGLTAEQAADQLVFRLSATDDQFQTIAKFRAARALWARVLEVSGVDEATPPPFHAVTAPVMYSRRDPWVNMLRGTVAAFAAGVAGATSVEVLPFDNAIPGGQPNVSRSFATRIARNTNLLLLEESHLGFVSDPAGGSYYVEQLTDQVADRAWTIFADVEKRGGLVVAADHVREELDAAHETRRADIAHRRTKVTAINEFPNLGEAPLPADRRGETENIRRWAADFEALRDRSDVFLEEHGRRPQVTLLPLGPLAKHNVRTGFATNLLASGGIEAVNPGQVVPGEDSFAESAATNVVVLCGADPEYAESGVAAVNAARAAGAEEVLLAGPEKIFADAPEASRPDGYLTMTIDAVAELSRLLDLLEA
ncbi:methylmalonyl-CoA mutase family protein [Corynebacterium sp. 335C]